MSVAMLLTWSFIACNVTRLRWQVYSNVATGLRCISTRFPIPLNRRLLNTCGHPQRSAHK